MSRTASFPLIITGIALSLFLGGFSISPGSAAPPTNEAEQKNKDFYIELVRRDVRQDAREIIGGKLALKQAEAEKFWPVYDRYEAELRRLGDETLAVDPPAVVGSVRSCGTAISTVLVATTLGAVAAPNLVGPTGGIAESVGIPVLAGPFVLGHLFDTVGRKKMISGTYILSGLLLAITGADPSEQWQRLSGTSEGTRTHCAAVSSRRLRRKPTGPRKRRLASSRGSTSSRK